MKRMRSWGFALLVAVVMAVTLTVASPRQAAEMPAKELWDKIAKKWNEVNSYECTLTVWGFKTPSFMKNFPEHVEKDDKPGWGYRVFKIKFRKPDFVVLEYRESRNENLNDPRLIDSAIAYVLTYVPGTRFSFGFKDKQKIYIVFPYISDTKFKELPVPAQKKAEMKLLMIASRKEIYHDLPKSLKDNRGNMLNETSIGIKMKQFEHYLKDGKVTVDKVKIPKSSDYTLNKQTGWLTIKKATGREVYRMTMVPNNVAKNKGITKAEVYIDPVEMITVGLTEYEGSKLVQVILFDELKLNVSVPDTVFTDMYKARKVSNTR